MLLLNPEALAEFDGIECSPPNAVVLGLAPSAFSYERLNEAFRLLLDVPDAPLIAVHKGRYLRVRERVGVWGLGLWTATVQTAARRVPCMRGPLMSPG